MNFKRSLAAFCLIAAAFVCISCAAATDANDTAITNSDNNATIIEENSETALNANENLQEAFDGDEAILSGSEITPEVTEIETEGDYNTGRAVFQLTDKDTDEPLDDVEVVLSFQCPGGLCQANEWTDEDGMVAFNFCDLTYIDENYMQTALPAGTYTACLTVDDDYISNESYYTTITVTSTEDSKIKPMVTEFNTGGDYETDQAVFRLTNFNTDEPLSYVKVNLVLPCPGGNCEVVSWTDDDGTATFDLYDLKYIDENHRQTELAEGTYKAYLSVDDEDISNETYTTYIEVTREIIPQIDNMASDSPITVIINPVSLSTSYQSGKYFTAKVTDSKTGKALSGVEITLTTYTGKTSKTVTLKSNGNGIVKYLSSKLDVGTHKVVLDVKKSNHYIGKTATGSIKITRAALKVSAPKVTKQYRKAGKFKVTVKNRESGKAVKGVKIIIKIYTGKKAKKIIRKTNANGQVSFSTKSLKKGNHKVVIIVKKTSKYKKASAKSSVRIVKKSSGHKKAKKSSSKKSSSKSSDSFIKRYYVFTSRSANSYNNSIYAPPSYAPQFYNPPHYGYY